MTHYFIEGLPRDLNVLIDSYIDKRVAVKYYQHECYLFNNPLAF